MICGVSAGGDEYLTFQRAAEGLADDDGVHLEHKDQSNGDYGCVQRCRLSRARLEVELLRQLGTLVGVRGFDVDLAIDDSSYAKLRAGLQRMFRDQANVLVVA